MAEKSKKGAKSWKDLEPSIDKSIKEHLIENYSKQILEKFQPRINGLVHKYFAGLPRHVIETDGDDLSNIARIEFFETIKAWNPNKYKDVWPLAYSRITGAMKDQIRFITKASPTRLYDWVTDAAYLYLSVEHDNSFEGKIESSVTLNRAMEELSKREKYVIFSRFKHDKTFKNIGDDIGISESQTTRIYKQTIKKLKKILGDKEEHH